MRLSNYPTWKIIVTLFAMVCLPVLLRAVIAVGLGQFMESPDEIFARAEANLALQENWEAYREEEKKNGGPLYRPEDLFAEIVKPDHWEDFFVPASVPEGFYYKDRSISSKSPGDWTIAYMFHDIDVEEKFFYLIQSADYDYNKEHLPDGVKKKEGQFFTMKSGTRNIVYWFYEDLTLYLEGNLPMAEMEALAQDMIHIDDIIFAYGAAEQRTTE